MNRLIQVNHREEHKRKNFLSEKKPKERRMLKKTHKMTIRVGSTGTGDGIESRGNKDIERRE
jgi:hypothetical protein